jgi:hypothetical protein
MLLLVAVLPANVEMLRQARVRTAAGEYDLSRER